MKEDFWFFLKFLETIFGITCIVFHVQGFMDDRQPLPHEMYFCGTFFGFTIIAIFGQIAISTGSRPSVIVEAITSATATFFFITCSICAMYHAEKDYHLMYLSDYEESVHPFFAINKKQSIAALICGLLYLLHSMFAFDALMITEQNFDPYAPELAKVTPMDIECYQPIKLYVCGKWIHGILQQQAWFQRLMGKKVEQKDWVIKIMDVKSMRAENVG